MSLNLNDEEIILAILHPGIYEMQTAFNLPLIAKKSNHNETEVQAVLQKLKGKDYQLPIKNNDSTLIFNEVRKMKEQLVGFQSI
jgi:ATP-dependent DNA helicase RecQ